MIASVAWEPIFARYFCGPLEVRVNADDAQLVSLARDYFSLYGRPWRKRTRRVHVGLARGRAAPGVRGSLLRCARMNVDLRDGEYVAAGISAISTRGVVGTRSDRWEFAVPAGLPFNELQVVELQDMLGLACTVGWRAEGWVPLHAAAVAKGEACAFLCAPSGGGKSTLTTALVTRRWQTLGDDKVLVRCEDGGPRVAALLQTFNLHPRTSAWFAQVGELNELPRYSQWTPKRRVSVECIFENAVLAEARPTHVVQLVRDRDLRGVRVTPMAPGDVLPVLLKQIVIPADREIARRIVGAASRIARGLRGFVFAVGDDAYADARWLEAFERATLP